MSLTSHLKDSSSPVSQFLREEFPNTKPVWQQIKDNLTTAHTIKPSEQLPYGTIGTATDYRIRFYFEITQTQELIASNAVTRLEMSGVAPGLVDCFRRDFVLRLDEKLKHSMPVGRRLSPKDEEQLARYCIVLALFDEVFRAGFQATRNSPLFQKEYSSSAELLSIPPSHWIDDLCSISWGFHENCAELFSRSYVLNPTFSGSADLGGADADIIIDEHLVEIKTSINVESSRFKRWLYQAIGYILLDYNNCFNFRGITFYFARQSVLIEWALDDLLNALSGKEVSLGDLRKRFKECISFSRRTLNIGR